MRDRQEFLKIFSLPIRQILGRLNLDFEKLQEIRLRPGKPLLVLWDGREYFVKNSGEASVHSGEGYCPQRKEILETMELLSGFSLYAFEEELRQGFLTIHGGHRVGVAGQVILENGKIKNLKHISFLNVRLCREIPGCADGVMPYVRDEETVCHTLLISPPRAGKTTMLRDMIRQVSDGNLQSPGRTVGVVDERSELGGCCMGVPQNDLGIRTDILDGCPKAEGIMMLIRSMAPEVIAVDEIGTQKDLEAVETAACCGCKVFATVHGSSMEELRNNPAMRRLTESGIFERYIFLQNERMAGRVKSVLDGNGRVLMGG